MSDYVIGHIRTAVPLIVGAAVTWLATTLDIAGLDDATTAVSGGLVVIVSAGYYAAVRRLAEKWPGVGVLLGVNQAPTYRE